MFNRTIVEALKSRLWNRIMGNLATGQTLAAPFNTADEAIKAVTAAGGAHWGAVTGNGMYAVALVGVAAEGNDSPEIRPVVLYTEESGHTTLQGVESVVMAAEDEISTVEDLFLGRRCIVGPDAYGVKKALGGGKAGKPVVAQMAAVNVALKANLAGAASKGGLAGLVTGIAALLSTDAAKAEEPAGPKLQEQLDAILAGKPIQAPAPPAEPAKTPEQILAEAITAGAAPQGAPEPGLSAVVEGVLSVIRSFLGEAPTTAMAPKAPEAALPGAEVILEAGQEPAGTPTADRQVPESGIPAAELEDFRAFQAWKAQQALDEQQSRAAAAASADAAEAPPEQPIEVPAANEQN